MRLIKQKKKNIKETENFWHKQITKTKHLTLCNFV